MQSFTRSTSADLKPAASSPLSAAMAALAASLLAASRSPSAFSASSSDASMPSAVPSGPTSRVIGRAPIRYRSVPADQFDPHDIVHVGRAVGRRDTGDRNYYLRSGCLVVRPELHLGITSRSELQTALLAHEIQETEIALDREGVRPGSRARDREDPVAVEHGRAAGAVRAKTAAQANFALAAGLNCLSFEHGCCLPPVWRGGRRRARARRRLPR